MFNESLTRFYAEMQKYPQLAKVFEVLKKTPEPAVHWYLILLVVLVTIFFNVGLAWMTFRNVSVQKDDLFAQTGKASTISRDSLQKALDRYDLRAVEFENVKQNPPVLTDPGR